MCIICIDLDRGKLTPWEASRNRTEMIDQFDEDHLKILDEKITLSLKTYLDNLKDDTTRTSNSENNKKISE